MSSVMVGSTKARQAPGSSSTSLHLVLPAQRPGVTYVRVRTRAGVSPTGAASRVTYVAPPTINAVSPAAAAAGRRARLTLTGRDLTYVTDVFVGQTRVHPLPRHTDTRIVLSVPARAAGSVAIRARSAFGTSAATSRTVLSYLAAPAIGFTRLPTGTAGSPYQAALSTADHRAGRWTVVGGSLPPGLRLSGASIVGTPTRAHVGDLVLRFTDLAGQHADREFGLFLASGNWTPSTLPLPDGARPGSEDLSAVDCPTSTWCAAEGTYVTTDGTDAGLLATWADGVWTTTAMRVGDTAAYPFPSVQTRSLSCAAAGSCAALGYTHNVTWVVAALVDGQWTTSVAPQPAGAMVYDLRSVSCGGPDLCVAVGDANRNPVIETWDGGSWTASTPAIDSTDRGSFLTDVDCADATDCTAVGEDNVVSPVRPLAVALSDGVWTQQSVPEPADLTTQYPGDTALHRVSCPTADTCTAVGEYRRQALFATHGAAGWTSTAALPDAHLSYLTSVACSATRCAVIGHRTVGSTWEDVLITQQDGSAPVLTGFEDGALDAVACPPSDPCVVSGHVTSPADSTSFAVLGRATDAGLVLERALTPTDAVVTAPSSWVSFVDSVSCPADGQCVAAGAYRVTGGADPLVEFGRE